MKTKYKDNIFDAISILIGTVVAAISLNIFLEPYNIAPGGVSGLAIIFNYILGGKLSVGMLVLIANIPLFLIGFRKLGKMYAIKSIVGAVLYSVFIDLLSPVSLYISENYLKIGDNDPDLLLYSIFGGILLGVGLGIVLRSGASTGGFDIVAQVLNKTIPHISTGKFYLALDATIVLIAAIVYKNLIYSLYAAISIMISSRLIDLVVEGFDHSRAVYIISEKSDEIASRIIEEIGRGVTSFPGKGVYTKKEKEILLCIISTRQIIMLKRLIKSIDDKAFVILTDVKEVIGEGFNDIKELD